MEKLFGKSDSDRKIIAVDFDHTLVNDGELILGARAAMQRLRGQDYYLLIYSCNDRSWIEQILQKHDVPYDEIYGQEGGKPACDCYVDDRAVGFAGDWEQTLQDIAGIEERCKKIKGLT